LKGMFFENSCISSFNFDFYTSQISYNVHIIHLFIQEDLL